MKRLSIRSKNLGLAGIIAYLLIVLNTISGLVIGPLLVHHLGKPVYGVYTTMHSFSSALSIVDFGVTQTLIRYVSNYRTNGKDNTQIARLCKTVKTINTITVSIAILVSICLYFAIPRFYSVSFSDDEVILAQQVFLIFAASTSFTLLSNYYSGIIAGYGYFAFLNIVKAIRVVLRICVITILAVTNANVIVIACVDLTLSVIMWAAAKVFYRKYIRIKKTDAYLDKELVYQIAVFTFLIFIQSLIDQLNSNLDNILIGSVIGAAAVSIYSFGLTVFSMFSQFSVSINQMLVPHMTKLLAEPDSDTKIELSLIRIGQIQFSLIGAIFFGFIVLGRQFIILWLGEEFLPVWGIAIILMLGSMLPLITNGVISILKAKNKMLFRTFSLLGMALVNAVTTYFLIREYGYFYACVGTALGCILVNTIVMYIYYQRTLNLKMLKIVWRIVRKILPCNMVACGITYYLSKNVSYSYLNLGLGILEYVVIYAILLWVFVLSKSTKQLVISKIRRVKK